MMKAATEYENPNTVDTKILILNEETLMGKKMELTLINQNHIPPYIIAVQDNPY